MPRVAKKDSDAKNTKPTNKKSTDKKSTEKKAKKTSPPKEPETVEVIETKEDILTNTIVEEPQDIAPSAADDFVSLFASLQEVTSKLSMIKTQFKALEKKHAREMKAATKSKRRAASKAPRTPSGFVKPTKISNELAAFLGKADGTEMARTEVTKEINAYIRSNGLQNKDNGRIINADSKLRTLLKLNGDDELTYFNLQRYMSPHFPKTKSA